MPDIADICNIPVPSKQDVPQFRALPVWQREIEISEGGKVMMMEMVADVATNHVFWLVPAIDSTSLDPRQEAAFSVFRDQIKGVFVAVIDPLPGGCPHGQCTRCGYPLP